MTVLLLESIHPEAYERLAAEVRVLHVEEPGAAARTAREERVEAIVTRGRGQVPRDLLAESPALRVVARVGIGLDNIDVEAATERGILVINSPGSTTIAVAEHTMMLVAAALRGLFPMADAVRAGRWEERRQYQGDDVAGKTLGIVGMGEIGRRVARLAEAYEMRVVYWSRRAKEVPYPRLALDELLAEADVVSLHTALTPETRGLLGRPELARMKPGALLVNTARGALVDERALLEALEAGRLGGFAADVLEQEPPDLANPLPAHPRALVTPHVAALTQETFRRMCHRTIGNVLAALRGEEVEAACVANGGGAARGRP